jgi:hypothetical protein
MMMMMWTTVRLWKVSGYENFSHITESLVYCELKQHIPWFLEECSKLLHEKKQAKLMWLQRPSQTNGDTLKNLRRETSRNFRNKKRERLKEKKINEL